MGFSQALDRVKEHAEAAEALSKGYRILALHESPICAVSGGSDSDDVLDIVFSLDEDKKVKYIFFDTGIEMEATKEHLDYLEQKYGIEIERVKSEIPVPLAVKKYGQPVFSKHISEMMMRLQKHNFQWEDASFEELIEKYPNCKSALKWWCDCKPNCSNGKSGILGIGAKPFLKQFIIENPPKFQISNKCCHYAKKVPMKGTVKHRCPDLTITGIRKSEGGIRTVAYHNCYGTSALGDEWRPLFWFTNRDKEAYEIACNVEHSKCYTLYGLKRTGCAACPFGDFEKELSALKEYEPKLYAFVSALFKESFAYMRAYSEYKLLHTEAQNNEY